MSQWRSLTPSSSLNRAGNGWLGKLIHIGDFAQYLNYSVQDYLWPMDVIVVQRNLVHPRIFDAMRYWQGMGKAVVVDLDDAYHFLPHSNPARPFWFEKPHMVPNDSDETPGGAIQMLVEGLRIADGLMSPNRLLLQDLEFASGNSYLLRNYAEPTWWGVPPPPEQTWPFGPEFGQMGQQWYRQNRGPLRGLPPRQTLKDKAGMGDKIVIGWGGSLSHYDSFWGSGLWQAVPKITARHPDLVWMICGSDKRLYDQFPVSRVNKHYQPGVPPDKWPEIVCHFDIGLAPLSGVYDQRRSWIKGIEYALAGTPFVATQGETYRDLQDWGGGIQGPNGAEFWEDALESIIQKLPDWQEKTEALLPEARRRFVVDNNITEYQQVFRQIIADRQGYQGTLPNVVRINGTSKKEAKAPTSTG